MRKLAIGLNIMCLSLAVFNVMLALWHRDLSQIGGWVSASCGWGLALMYSAER